MTLANNGTINLNGAIVSGTGSLVNAAGGIISGRGAISSTYSNTGGTLLVTDNATNVTSPFSNSSIIQLSGVSAALTGGAIANSGVIQGNGTVGNAIINTGSIKSLNGSLQLTGAITNAPAGSIYIPAGAELLIAQGLASNLGSIAVVGGTFDNNNHPIANSGQVAATGGVLRAGSWNNIGQLDFAAGANQIFGGLSNAATGKVILTGGATATFYNPVSGSPGSEIRVGANSTAVFLAAVTGPIAFTGSGAKFFEAGQSSTGPIASGGVTTVEAAASVTADYVREDTLAVNGTLNLRSNAAASKVSTLSITPGGKLDLSNDALIVDYTVASPASSIRSAIINGAITSSSLSGSTAIGYGEASDASPPPAATSTVKKLTVRRYSFDTR